MPVQGCTGGAVRHNTDPIVMAKSVSRAIELLERMYS
jgi:hypothetical protein